MKPIDSFMRSFVELHPQDAARSFENLKIKEAASLLKKLPPKIAASLLDLINPTVAEPLFTHLDHTQARELLPLMSPRSASTILQRLDPDVREVLLTSLEEKVARSLRDLATYEPDTAGAIMHPRVASLRPDMTMQQAVASIRKVPRDVLHYLYVADRSGVLCGVVTMRDLLVASPKATVESIIIRDPISVIHTAPRTEAEDILRQGKLLTIPVIDDEGRLVGAIRRADILQAGEAEAFEGFQKLVGAGAEERALSPVSTVVKSRLPWLYVNLLTAFLAAAVVGVFEDIIAQMAALAVLLPVVAGQGGNTGSQSLAVVMRGLALREISPSVRNRVIRKELLGGFLNGLGVSLITALCVFGWRMMAGDGVTPSLGLALVIALSMTITMVVAAFSGAIIPMILSALGRDPAQSASIFLTTVTDIIGFATFLGFAVLFKTMILG